jgi:hypothetical protein
LPFGGKFKDSVHENSTVTLKVSVCRPTSDGSKPLAIDHEELSEELE